MDLKFTVELHNIEKAYPELYDEYNQVVLLAKECGLTEESTLENSIMFGIVRHMKANLKFMKEQLEKRIKERNEEDDE